MTNTDNLSPSGETLFVFAIISIIVLWPAVALRTYIRIKYVKIFGTDDWLMLVAVAAYTWLVACDIELALQGYGNINISTQHRIESAKYLFFSQLAYYFTVTLARLSVCFFYLRITPVEWQRWIIYVLALVNIAMALACFIDALLICQPVSYNWEQWAHDSSGQCKPSSSTQALGTGQNVVSSISDFFLSLLPLLLLKDSTLALRLKLIVIGLLGIGVVSGVAAVIRFVKANSVGHDTPDSFVVSATTWSAIEPFCCILAATIATYRPLFKRIFEGLSKSLSVPRTNMTGSDPTWNPQNTHASGRLGSQRMARMGRLQRLDSGSDVNLVLQDFSFESKAKGSEV